MKRIFLLIAALTLNAQQPPAFEAASVKPYIGSDGGYSTRVRGAQFEMENFPLRRIIQFAYNYKDYAYAGPSGLESVRFDVMAKMPAGGDTHQIPAMMQALLADRFKLVVHREQREIAGLNLVVDKKGLRINPVEHPDHSGTAWGSNVAQVTSSSMDVLADILSNALNRPVKNATGLSGLYTVKLRWLADNTMPPADTNDFAPSVYAAVQDIGLRLEVMKTTVEVLVVDRCERAPSDN